MFDLRYHLASLAAVFIALAVGILLGVAISGKLSNAENNALRSENRDLANAVQESSARVDVIERRSQAAEKLLELTYPALMEGRLDGRGFAVLFFGPVEGSVRSAIERTLADAGAGAPVRLIALDTPVDALELDGALNGNEELAQFATGGDDFADLGDALGRELVEGGGTPLWSALSSTLIEERLGATLPQVDGAIVVQSWIPPEDPSAEQEQEARATQSLLEGLLAGLQQSGVPVVGVETTPETDSAIDLYRRQGVSSVDDVETLAGRVALALILAGAEPGHYGVKDSASDGVSPPIDSVPVPGG
ncbi:MAG: copper transporter [Gaiellaceae bacterium]